MGYKYELLVNILDKLRMEAPSTYKTYYPSKTEVEKLDKARSLAFIHLLLKVRFGVTNFLDRHKLITDGTQDGGLDAYYIDEDQKRLYLVQSKFRTTEENFENKSISAEELLKIEVTRITKGNAKDSNDNKFNSKITAFQEELRSIRDIAKYQFIVVFLGNVYKFNDEQIRRMIDNSEYEIYDAERAYAELIFPLTSGTYYNPDEIIIRLELSNKEHPRLKQVIETDFGEYNITAIFVPTFEIAKVMSKYKNAILKYNPRNFLSLQKKSVNESIRQSILNQEKNNFALLNNGITILSNNLNITENTGKTNEGQLILTTPQILNGGQTAYTLCVIYEEHLGQPKNPLLGKEVLLKIITPIKLGSSFDTKFIELISNATNQQNEVSEADRRSNHEIQIELQKKIYEAYGYLYERKQGEFFDGINEGYIDSVYVIDRLDFIKAYWAYKGEPAAARRTSEKVIFQEDYFYRILNELEKCKEMFFSYILFKELQRTEEDIDKSESVKKFGYSLLYGKWAVIASIGLMTPEIPDDPEELATKSKELVATRLKDWKNFDAYVREKHRDTRYFGEDQANFELFYKVSLLDEDVREFFLK